MSGIFAVILSSLTVILLAGIVFIYRVQQPEVRNDSWRDRPSLVLRMIRPLINLFAYRIAQSTSREKLRIVDARLISAGYGYVIKPEEFIATRRIALVIGVLVFMFFYMNLDLSLGPSVFLGLFIGLVSFYYPDIWLNDEIKKRKRMIERQFPFFLDLLVLSMRAGLNFSSAISHAVDKMAEGPVRVEFAKYLRETRTGATRRDALSNLAKRININSITNFVAVINQVEETGGELGAILLNQAAQRRVERFNLAEKLANQAPVKMMFPLLIFLFPITLVVILFPMFIKARDAGAFQYFGG